MTRTLIVRRVVVRYVLLILFVKNVKTGQMISVKYICSDRILTCRIKSIRSPARWDWLLQI